MFSIHHAIADGWSLGVFVQDLCTAYVMGLSGFRKAVAVGVMGLSNTLPPVPQTYSEWAAAERAFWQPAELEPRAAFWKSQLAGYAPNLERHRGAGYRLGRACSAWFPIFPPSLANAARELARRSGATLFSTLLAAFQLALSRWTGAEDILVGTPVANRTKQAVRETMGYFAGIVPLRGQVEPERSFSDRAARGASDDGGFLRERHALCRTGPRARRCGRAGAQSDFRSALRAAKPSDPRRGAARLSAKLRMRSTGTARFDLGCEITEEAEAARSRLALPAETLSGGGGGKPWTASSRMCSPVPAARRKASIAALTREL